MMKNNNAINELWKIVNKNIINRASELECNHAYNTALARGEYVIWNYSDSLREIFISFRDLNENKIREIFKDVDQDTMDEMIERFQREKQLYGVYAGIEFYYYLDPRNKAILCEYYMEQIEKRYPGPNDETTM